MNGIKTLWPWVGLLAAVLNAQAEGPSIEQAPSQPWKPRTSAVYDTEPACQSHVVRGAFASIQVNVDLEACNIPEDAANEPSIAVDPGEPRKIVIGWRQFNSVESDFREAGYAYSHDGGHTWVFPGSLAPGTFHSDPVLAADGEGRIYYHAITLLGDLFRTSDGGITWDGPRPGLDGDKPWMTVDRSNSEGRGNLYICGQGGFARSFDYGETFQRIPGGGCWMGTVAVSAVGDVNVVYGDGDYVRISRSVNAYDPIATPFFPPATLLHVGTYGFGSSGPENPGGLIGQVWVATSPAAAPEVNDVYIVTLSTIDPLSNDDDDVAFVASRDGGVTWERPVFINNDPLGPKNFQWFPVLSVAPNGRIDVIWNDTRNSLQANLSEVFYSYSVDGGRTWSPNVPVSPMFDSWVGWPAFQQKIGDYYHMVSDNLGVNVAYAATFNGEQDVYFLRIGPWDCNGNEIDDAADIASATSKDCNANDVPDECEYRVDIDGDGLTTLDDYTLLAAALSGPSAPLIDKEGAGGGPPVAGAMGSDCAELFDANHDGHIDLADYAYLQRVFVAP